MRVNHEAIAKFSTGLLTSQPKSRYNLMPAQRQIFLFFKETIVLNCKLSHGNTSSTAEEELVTL